MRLEAMRAAVEANRERVGELWSRVGALKARKGEREGALDKVEWAVADEEGLRQILEVRSKRDLLSIFSFTAITFSFRFKPS